MVCIVTSRSFAGWKRLTNCSESCAVEGISLHKWHSRLETNTNMLGMKLWLFCYCIPQALSILLFQNLRLQCWLIKYGTLTLRTMWLSSFHALCRGVDCSSWNLLNNSSSPNALGAVAALARANGDIGDAWTAFCGNVLVPYTQSIMPRVSCVRSPNTSRCESCGRNFEV